MNSLPRTVTRQRRGCDLNPGRSAPESSTLTNRLPSHPHVDPVLAELRSSFVHATFETMSFKSFSALLKSGLANHRTDSAVHLVGLVETFLVV